MRENKDDIEDSKTTALEYAFESGVSGKNKNRPKLKPTILRLENHEKPKLTEMLQFANKATPFEDYLWHGIVPSKEAMSWLEERSKTVLDRKPEVLHKPKYDEFGNRLPAEPLKDLPPSGSVMEKIYANTVTTPTYFKRNRQWT